MEAQSRPLDANDGFLGVARKVRIGYVLGKRARKIGRKVNDLGMGVSEIAAR